MYTKQYDKKSVQANNDTHEQKFNTTRTTKQSKGDSQANNNTSKAVGEREGGMCVVEKPVHMFVLLLMLLLYVQHATSVGRFGPTKNFGVFIWSLNFNYAHKHICQQGHIMPPPPSPFSSPQSSNPTRVPYPTNALILREMNYELPLSHFCFGKFFHTPPPAAYYYNVQRPANQFDCRPFYGPPNSWYLRSRNASNAHVIEPMAPKQLPYDIKK
uniref:Uncharacterized protein n=1 Tax=Glossina pallidipes TaxID=7398 RepID=A0A1A9ZMU7_GLOPL